MGLLDLSFDNLDDPKKQMLLAMAAGLLTPQHNRGLGGFGAALGQAVPMGLNQYAQAQNMQSQMAQRKQAMELQKLTADEMRRKLAEATGVRSVLAGTPQGQSPYEDSPAQPQPQAVPPSIASGYSPVVNPELQSKGPMPQQQTQGKMAEYQRLYGLAKTLEQRGYVDAAQQYYDKAEKARPEVKDTKTLTQNGQRVTVNIYKDGTTEVVPFNPDLEKLHFLNTQDKAGIGLDPFTGKKITEGIGQGMSPADAARIGQSDTHFWATYTKPTAHEGPSGLVWTTPPSGMKPGEVRGTGIGPKMDSAQKTELLSLDAQIAQADQAIDAVKKNPTAFGFKRGAATMGGAVTESMAGRRDTQQEAEARAFVYNVVSGVIKERAGTAQSVAEMARLRSFLPGDLDKADQIENKLTSFKKYLAEKRHVYSSPVGQPPSSSSGVVDFNSLPK